MSLRAGDIVYIYVPSLQNPKEKFAVVACLEPRPLLLLISTDKTAFKQANPVLDADQLVIDARGHPFLAYDSWLDCTEPHCLDGVVDHCTENPEAIKGHVSTALRARILKVVAASTVLTRRNIKWILDGLS